MHSSIVIAGLCATLAVANPLHHLGHHAKKDYVTDIEVVVETVYVTITEGSPVETPAPASPTSTVVVVNTVYAGAEKAQAGGAFADAGQAQAQAGTVFAAAQKPASSSAPAVVEAPKPTTTAAPVVVAPVATPAASSAAAPVADTSYEGVVLAQHNVHRANHSANALVYNATLAGYAKTIAETCVWGHDMTQGGGGYGQNIVENGQLPWTGVNLASAAAFGITEQWYNGEEPFYASSFGLDNPNTSADVLHFTQVVWKATTSVGCYTATCAQGTVDARAPTAYTVCNYFPQGNFGGEYAKNVGRPLGNAASDATITWSS